MRVTTLEVQRFKSRGERFPVLTAYDYPTAKLVEEAGVPVILVGDSLGSGGAGLQLHHPGDDGGDAAPHCGGGARHRARDGHRRHALPLLQPQP